MLGALRRATLSPLPWERARSCVGGAPAPSFPPFPPGRGLRLRWVRFSARWLFPSPPGNRGHIFCRARYSARWLFPSPLGEGKYCVGRATARDGFFLSPDREDGVGRASARDGFFPSPLGEGKYRVGRATARDGFFPRPPGRGQILCWACFSARWLFPSPLGEVFGTWPYHADDSTFSAITFNFYTRTAPRSAWPSTGFWKNATPRAPSAWSRVCALNSSYRLTSGILLMNTGGNSSGRPQHKVFDSEIDLGNCAVHLLFHTRGFHLPFTITTKKLLRCESRTATKTFSKMP